MKRLSAFLLALLLITMTASLAESYEEDIEVVPAPAMEEDFAEEPQDFSEWLYQGDEEIVPAPEEETDYIPRSATMYHEGDYIVVRNDDMTCQIVDYSGAGGDVTIPEVLSGHTVTTLGEKSFAESAITAITIPQTVTSVGDRAFENCYSLKTAVFTSKSLTLGIRAFQNDESLKKVTFAGGMSDFWMDELVFYNCPKLESLRIPSALSPDCVARKAFKLCGKLTLTFEDGIAAIPDNFIFDSADLNAVILPASVRRVGAGAFSGLTNTTLYIMGDQLSEIGASAFSGIKQAVLTKACPAASYLKEQGVKLTQYDSMTEPGIIQFTNGSDSATIYLGETLSLDVRILPRTSSGTLTWKSEDASIATVSQDGLVTAKAVGDTSIVVTANNGVKAAFSVAVRHKGQQATQIKITEKSPAMNVGETIQLHAALTPSNAVSEVRWSTGSDIVIVTKDGFVTAMGKGQATITAATENGLSATVVLTVNDPYTPTALAFSEGAKATLELTDTLRLTPLFTPNTASSTLTWSTSNANVAAVSDQGLIRPVSVGQAVITAVTENGKSASITVTVMDKRPTGIAIAQGTKATLVEGDILSLTAKLTPANAVTTLNWSSENNGIAAVTKDGIIRAVKAGETRIVVKTDNGLSATLTLTVTAPAKPTSISIAQGSKATVKMGATLKLTTSLSPSVARSALTFASAKPKVATVSADGVVTPVAEGTVRITVTTENRKKATITITVVDPYKPTAISLKEGGSVTVEVGGNVTLHGVLKPETARTTVTWKNGNAKLLKLTAGGTTAELAGLKEGKTKVTATTANNKKVTITVTVIDPYKPESISIDQGTRLVMNVGETLALTTSLSPKTARTALTWKSSGPKVAQVTDAGRVTAYKKGTAKITVTTANRKKAVITIAVVDPYEVLDITIDEGASIIVCPGTTVQLHAALHPTTARSALTWSSGSRSVATVSNTGLVTALKKGSTTITVRTENGKKTKIKIKVVE